MAESKKFPSELRYDVVSKDWVVIATGRAKRPEDFRQRRRKVEEPRSQCPFCQLSKQGTPTLIFVKGKRHSFLPARAGGPAQAGNHGVPKGWTTASLPNKFPAFIPSLKLQRREEGELYHILNAVGFHEVVVTRSHTRQVGQFSVSQTKELIDVFQERYLVLMKEKFVRNIAIFQNHGVEAGASLAHPHSQIITTPLIDPDLRNALLTSERFFRKHKKCIYCVMGEWELRSKKRIVFENDDFLVLCPFASKAAFEIIISPKKHLPQFEQITEKEKLGLAEAFKIALSKLRRALADPAYNFYLHTAPIDGKKYDFYHWHWTILPKTATWAGFEIGTGMEISTIEPERAAEFLRKQ
ncbi:MAG: hypothetical protein A3J30_02370 [Candidatus Wildermuthbacteria bacterium RIFCSPLOWO2_02_FULL_47_9c]|uniref:UDP-glucose--hexose-1-phosphate uridylyltransferase n=2 Tax=Parcubacteria group TaxID=1794811 RepID=A0A837IN18_9BACT|nr:MAG: hypothetical protein UY25_C0002G0168 [Candidatus Yanofskybacteria bacterium GW2011_GWC1_48_11]KKW04583.1 MAG: Galactose-1-phosphate uridylyltransferase [Parcubacteria group bacterium GW2011_GWB1_49_12]KKW09159.1 MAG: Galactose-1-phosphate uridylyltransferase [Parcubacteria group bacterium GW2011_GWA1_49_26]KKW13506.1 MAG: Galactose-1-phosphate uridylyltransferase [Parcubacteria group bacterium GW2011_GWA2_50_10]OHA61414.1 MAG: hypothetical protein A2109_00845 [Candidatus Wildermuthbacte